MDLKVQKRDGGQESFDRQKIVSGVIRAGATIEQAEKISQEVETWAAANHQNGVVTTLEIRNKVLELLTVTNPEASKNFSSFRKP